MARLALLLAIFALGARAGNAEHGGYHGGEYGHGHGGEGGGEYGYGEHGYGEHGGYGEGGYGGYGGGGHGGGGGGHGGGGGGGHGGGGQGGGQGGGGSQGGEGGYGYGGGHHERSYRDVEMTGTVDTTNPDFIPKPITPEIELTRKDNFVGEFNYLFWQALGFERENYGYSPLGIRILMDIIFAGARGTTAEQIGKVLRMVPNPDEVIDYSDLLTRLIKDNLDYIDIANALFVDDIVPLNPEYVEKVRKSFYAFVKALPLEEDPVVSKMAIDAWVSEKTHGYIKQVMMGIEPVKRTGLLLASAFYINRRWAFTFREENTRRRPFNTPEGGQQLVPMMHEQASLPYMHLPDLAAKAVLLPYQGGDMDMLVLLPDRMDGFAELERKLTGVYTPLAIANKMVKEVARVTVAIPRFNVRYSVPFKEALRRIGVTDLFEPSADLSGLSPQRPYVNDIYQEIYLHLNEHGTQSATVPVATGVTSDVLPEFPDEKDKFVADHPFLFFILNRQPKVVVFQGRYVKSPEII